MTSPGPTRSPPLPTKEQCFSLSEAQCHKILMHRDPNNGRANKNWELAHQPELVRLYMTMVSFPQIRDAMKQKLDYCYKTYANRYKDWHLPVDRSERDQAVRELFSQVSDSTNYHQHDSSTSLNSSRLPIRNLQPQPNHESPSTSQRPYTVPQDFLFPAQQPPPNYPPPSRPPPQHPPRYPPPSLPPPSLPPSYPPPSHPLPNVLIKQENIRDSDQMSIASTATWSTGSAQSVYSSYFDDTFSSPRFSISTANSSVSSGSRLPPGVNFPGLQQPEAPKHDPARGSWNGLRVIPCGKNHSTLHWNVPFVACGICGFSQWHALMIHARTINVNTFTTAMIGLMDICKPDFAGNHTAHFLMAAGVGMEYFTQPRLDLNCNQNAFGQNPLHALDPQDLGEDLISFLQWFKAREHPEGLLLTQRDMKGRTPMHYLLQKPLERQMYQRVLKVFPYEHHQLRTFDTAGRTAIMLMNRASLRIKPTSPGDYARIQAGITETKLYQASGDNTQHANTNVYGFHDIARGARGTSYTMAGMPFNFECRICNQTNAHTNSYLDQMLCACKFGRDRNGPDETGMTAAHALVTQERCNNDHRQSVESPSQTFELLRVLIPKEDTTLREILHVLDRDGNSLTHNIAVRGLDELLQYVLDLEVPSRRRAMVNSCSRNPKGGEWSVLRAVMAKFDDMLGKIRIAQVTEDHKLRHLLIEKSNRLTKVKHILRRAGAEINPSITTRWQICWPQ